MRLAEILLRLGCSLVGWMVVVAYLLWLAVVSRMECGDGLAELLGLLVFAGPGAALLSTLTLATYRLPEIHSILRWAAIFPALLLPAAVMVVYRYSTRVYADAVTFCGGADPSSGDYAWPIVQLGSLLAILIVTVKSFRAPLH